MYKKSLALLALVGLVILGGCSTNKSTSKAVVVSTTTTTEPVHTVYFTWFADNSTVSVTVQAGSVQSQLTSAKGYVLDSSGPSAVSSATTTVKAGDSVYISVQDSGESPTIAEMKANPHWFQHRVVCSIWVDGKNLVANSSTGAYSIATCSGQVPAV